MPVPARPRVFGTALRARWDDDALRLGASLAYDTFCDCAVLLVALAIAGMAFGADHPGEGPEGPHHDLGRRMPWASPVRHPYATLCLEEPSRASTVHVSQ